MLHVFLQKAFIALFFLAVSFVLNDVCMLDNAAIAQSSVIQQLSSSSEREGAQIDDTRVMSKQTCLVCVFTATV
jgi:hypothetical protein